MDAPICWMGGKHYLRNEIIKRFPKHTCYVESFGGAGWVLFAKGQSKVEVYNDIDSELANFFKIIKNCRRAFLESFDLILVSRKLFKDFIDTDPADLNEIQRAVRFFYIVKTSFGGKWHDANFGYAKTTKSGLNIEAIHKTITEVHARLSRVYIEHGSFEKTVERYDGPDTLFFLDPPYYGLAQYTNKMVHSDYERLKEILAGIAGKFLMTINDCPEVRELFSGYVIEEAEVPYSIAREVGSRGKYGELMVMNYEREGLGL